MKTWTPERIAQAAGARLVSPPPTTSGPERAVVGSRQAGPGVMFVGLRGQSTDGGRFAAEALAAGAWGVLTTPEHAEAARCARPGVLLAAHDPLAALQDLARAWRRELGARVIGVTGSTGKTSTKDLLLAILSPHRLTVASRANFNTEIGLPLEILSAPAGTEVLVLEMAMRGPGQIAELAGIAEPDVGVVVTVGPVHLELLGTVEGIAAAKAELIAALAPGATAVVPANEPLLTPHLREDLHTVAFGEGGEVHVVSESEQQVEIRAADELIVLEVPFRQAHLRRNLLAAVAAAKAIGVTAGGRVELALTPGRGQRLVLERGITIIDDCYNANPMSMRAALEDLAASAALADPPRSREGANVRLIAVLGDMLELGPQERQFHVEIGRHASRVGVDLLVTVGLLGAAIAEGFDGEVKCVENAAQAAALVPALLHRGDIVLVKASRAVGLELLCRTLSARDDPLTAGETRA